MNKSIFMAMLIFVTALASSPLVWADDQQTDQDRLEEQDRDQLRKQVYGWDLMTPEERMQHREMMRNMKTEEERDAYRKEHHKRMQERARQQGVELPPYQSGRGFGSAGGGRGNR
ncbi:MAG: hypothetical protein OEY87_04365 [Gammaproteobacteria bacterium]|nr:hypothetical protein [Gammaproteobacteria bacterium]